MLDLQLSEMDAASRRERVSASGLSKLREHLLHSGAKFAILDPLVAYVPYGLNDGGVMAGVMKGLKQIGAELDCAVLIIAHTRKGGNADADGAEITAGSAAITNLCRGVMTVSALKDAVCREIGVLPGEERDMRELVDLKANLKRLEERRFFKLVGVWVANGTAEFPGDDCVAVAEAFAPVASPIGAQFPLSTLRVAVDTIAAGATGGGWALSPAPMASSHRRVTKVLQKALAGCHPSGGALVPAAFAEAVYRELIHRGWLVKQANAPMPNNNTASGLFVKWADTPWSTEAPAGRNVA